MKKLIILIVIICICSACTVGRRLSVEQTNGDLNQKIEVTTDGKITYTF